MRWTLIVVLFFAAQSSLGTAQFKECTSAPQTLTGDADVLFTADTPVTGGLDITCMNYTLSRCGKDATGFVGEVLVLFGTSPDAIHGSLGTPVGLMQTSSLDSVRTSVKADHYFLKFIISGDARPKSCVGDTQTMLTYSIDIDQSTIALPGDDGAGFLPPMVAGSPGVFQVNTEYSLTFLQPFEDARGKFVAGLTCDDTFLKKMKQVTTAGQKTVVITSTAVLGGFFTACVELVAGGAPEPLVKYLVVGGENGILSKIDCGEIDVDTESTCKATVVHDSNEGATMMLVPAGSVCADANTIPGTLKDVPVGAAQEVEITIAAGGIERKPHVCFKSSPDVEWLRTIGEDEVNAETLRRAEEIVQTGAVERTNGQTAGTTIGALGFGLIAGGVVVVAIIAASIAGIVYYRRRRKGFGVKLKALMLN